MVYFGVGRSKQTIIWSGYKVKLMYCNIVEKIRLITQGGRPVKTPWNQEAVHILPAKLDLAGQPWCRAALLLHVQGTGALRWEARALPSKADPYSSAFCITLRGTPLLSAHIVGCGTSESFLCTGWGLDRAECPELETLRKALNGSFACLEDAVPTLSPLLELLPEGCYVLAEGEAYPAEGGGRFFWDVPDHLASSPATGMAYLNDDDYDVQYEHLPPVFLYPSQRRSRLNMEQVSYYMERIQQDGPLPHGLALGVTEGISVLLDGHHKAAAAALLGRPLPCLTVLRLEHYELRPVTAPPRHLVPVIPRRYERYAGCFGPFTVPVEDMCGVKLPENPWKLPQDPHALPEGRLADAELPKALLAVGKRYPAVGGYALVSAAAIGFPSDEQLDTWLASPDRYRPQLRAALVLLRSRGDPRLKETALRCAAAGDEHCSLKKEAFQALAEMKGDAEAETFFVDYFVGLDEPPDLHGSARDDLTEIAHSFWSSLE